MPSGTARWEGGVDLQQVRATYRDETRSAILAAAARILSEEGPAALTVRRVAEVVNASTKMIYTRSEEHTSELQSLMRISYAVFCLKKNKEQNKTQSAYPHLVTID